MKTAQIALDKIKPDPNQPRKVFSQSHIEGLAESIKTEGIINPIEIDSDNTIITGECRWRAAKLLGLKKVPVQLYDGELTDYERLRRQIAENVHQSGSTDEAMNPIDTAMGYKRLLEMMGWAESERDSLSRNYSDRGKEYVEHLAKEVGVTARTIYNYLRLLEQPDFVIEKVRQGDAPRAYIAATKAPEEYVEPLQRKVAEGKLVGHRAVDDEVSRIKKFPELAEINVIDPNKITAKVNRIVKCVTQLGLALEDQPLNELQEYEKKLVGENLSWLMKKLVQYVQIQSQEKIG